MRHDMPLQSSYSFCVVFLLAEVRQALRLSTSSRRPKGIYPRLLLGGVPSTSAIPAVFHNSHKIYKITTG